MKDCYLIYTCDEWKSKSSMQLEYIVEDNNDIFKALRELAKREDIEVDSFPGNVEESCNYLYLYQNNMNKVFNGNLDLSDLDARLKYCSIQKFTVGV